MTVKFLLDRLQKEIETLTYNSRTVLNALIHSVTVSGSNKGFKSVRTSDDIEIFLTRVDIYRIYTFYKDWETNNFHVGPNVVEPGTQKELTGFYNLIAEHDLVPVKTEDGTNTTATTDALVKHSQVLFLNDENKTQLTNDTFWLDLIKNTNNPKLITNTAPIPINLRTPIFDVNLSTTKFNTHPTYLFPMGYFSADILGYSGDGVNHNLSGNSWTISADEFINLEAENISLGAVDVSAVYKTKEARTGLYSLSFGFDSHAQGDYSLSGGFKSIVPDNSQSGDSGESELICAIAIGNRNIASYSETTALGGRNNSASGNLGAVVGGTGNRVTSYAGGILAGTDNTVGGKWFDFKFPENVNPSNNNVILVRGNQEEEFYKRDAVRLFDFTFDSQNYSNQSYQNVNGDAEKSRSYHIDNVSYQAEETSVNYDYTQITLSNIIPRHGEISGGKISKWYDIETRISLGFASSALGRGLIVEGKTQTVVGQYNDRNKKARNFVVGVGTNSRDGRKNVFETYDDGFTVYGTPKKGNYFTLPTEGEMEPTDDFVGARFSQYGLDMLVKKYRFSFQHSGLYRGLKAIGNINDTNEFSIIATNSDGIKLVNKNSTGITIQSGTGAYGGFTRFGDGGGHFDVNVLSDESFYVETRSHVILNATNKGNLKMSWDGSLLLTGNSMGALPASSDQFNHNFIGVAASQSNKLIPAGSNKYGIHTIFNTGFYGLNVGSNPILGPSKANSDDEAKWEKKLGIIPESGSLGAGYYHLLNYGIKENNSDKFYNLQFLYGSEPAIGTGRIGVRKGKSTSAGDTWISSYALEGQNMKRLGWFEDILYKHTDNVGGSPSSRVYEEVQFGHWKDVPDGGILEVLSGMDGGNVNKPINIRGQGYDFSDNVISEGDYTAKLRYTIIGKTLFFELFFEFGEQNGLPNTANSDVRVIGLAFDNPYRQLFEPDFMHDVMIPYTPTFQSTRYYNHVVDPSPAPASEGYDHRIYTLQLIRNSNPNFGNQISFLIYKGGKDGSTTPEEKGNYFSSDFDTNAPMYFSGFYPMKNTTPLTT